MSSRELRVLTDCGQATPGRDAHAVLISLAALCKPRLSALSVLTTLAGFLISGGARLGFLAGVVVVTGTTFAASGAGAINQFMERHPDARMRRTRGRPLPSGALKPAQALAFGFVVAAAGVGTLLYLSTPIPALLAGATLGVYTLAYTPLKRVTALNTLVGAVAGALPPLIGCAAAKGGVLGREAWLLFALLYAWQLPHFWSIAWLHRADYRRGGFVMLASVPGGESVVAGAMTAHATMLLLVSLLFWGLGEAGPFSGITSLIAGLVFLVASRRFQQTPDDERARTALRVSLVYLPVVLAALVLDRMAW